MGLFESYSKNPSNTKVFIWLFDDLFLTQVYPCNCIDCAHFVHVNVKFSCSCHRGQWLLWLRRTKPIHLFSLHLAFDSKQAQIYCCVDMTCGFTSFSILSSSYQDDGKVIMKDDELGNPVYS